MLKTYSELKINNQKILQEHIDESYEPTEEEIREYASYIGIDPDKELDLLWLAREGLMKPLPPGWKPCQEENGELYYFNFDTGKSSWDHPYDDIYKARVIQTREKKSSIIMTLDTHSKGKNTSNLSDLSSGKHPTGDHHYDSQYINSDGDDELIYSENDHEHNSDGFQQDVYFGIDRQLSARIEHEENQLTEGHPEKDDNERMKLADLAAQAAERRLSANKIFTHELTPREDIEITKLRTRLEQSTNDEKLQLLEDNRIAIEKFKTELQLTKEQEERQLREKMKEDLKLMENNLRENLSREKKLLETRQTNELNTLKQTIEKQKQDLKKKLKDDLLTEINLEQKTNASIQINLLQIKHEYEEKLRNMENRYKNELEELKRRYEQTKIEKTTCEKRLQDKNDFCVNLQRTIDQLRSQKSSLERRLSDAETELKVIDQDNSNVEQTLSNTKTNLLPENDDDQLSDTDSDMIQMRQTLSELKHITTLPITPIKEKEHNSPVIDNLSLERTTNSSLIDSGRWSNTLLSTIGSNTFPLGTQTLHQYQSPMLKNHFWSSQSSLITREAVLKAARDVLPPGVIDHLTSKH